MLRICAHPDCTTLTLGTLCLVHEPPVLAERWPRGRPYARRERRLPAGAALPETAGDELTPAGSVSFGGGTAT
jgi:hypothetical protein